MDQASDGVQIRVFPWKWGLGLAAGLLLVGWLLNTPPGFLGKADAIGYAVCHRIDLRSFHLGSRPLPLCARCTGMYLGAFVSLIFQSLIGTRRSGTPPIRVLIGLGLLVLAFSVDGINSFLYLIIHQPLLYQPHNELRLLTGTGMGIVIPAMLFPAFNQTVWQEWDSRPALEGLRSLGILLLLALGVDALVLTQNQSILLPAALISAASVVILLIMVYTMVCLMVFRAENRFTHFFQLGPALTGGFLLAMLQITLIDVVRYALTGTWAGFLFS